MQIKEIENKRFYQYAKDVIDGKIVAGQLLVLACKRFMNDLQREDLEFRYEIGDRFIEFSKLLKHFKGKSTGQQFILEPWQEFMVYNILCFYWKGTNNRRFTSSLLCISRKSGKTAFAALFCLWFLLFDNEGSPECDLASNSRAQSGVAYEFVEQFARQLDPKGKDLQPYRNQLRSKLNNGKVNVFAADSTKLDGWNSSFYIWDEAAAAKDSKMYDILRSSQGQRANPHGMIISTVGFNLASPFYEMYQVGSDVLHGLKTDDSYFYMIFSLDENDNWEDEKVWKKIAPNLGVTVDRKYLREQVVYAKNNPSSLVGILTKNFNKWCSSSEVWIPYEYIQKVSAPIKFEDFDNRTMVYVGLDLASTSDLASIAILFHTEEKIYIKNLYFLPESALEESPNRELYKYWQRTNQLIVTPGNVTDYDYILNELMKIFNNYCLQKIMYDNWNASFLTIKATENGLPMEPFGQNITNMSKPTKMLERLIRMGNVVIDNNEINRFCYNNAVVKTDWNENIKIIKGSKDSKIDGCVAQIMALGGVIEYPPYSSSVISFI